MIDPQEAIRGPISHLTSACSARCLFDGTVSRLLGHLDLLRFVEIAENKKCSHNGCIEFDMAWGKISCAPAICLEGRQLIHRRRVRSRQPIPLYALQ